MAVKKDDVKDILYQQLQLLVIEERRTNDINIKLRIAGEINRISSTILNTSTA